MHLQVFMDPVMLTQYGGILKFYVIVNSNLSNKTSLLDISKYWTIQANGFTFYKWVYTADLYACVYVWVWLCVYSNAF